MNSLQKKEKPKFSVALQSDAYKNLINNTLQDKQVAARFIANISTVVAQNPALQDCTPASIISGGLVAESLHLSMLSSLGFFHLVPYKKNKKDEYGNWTTEVLAQAQIGYKGYIQLAVRSGQYATINVCDIKEGEPTVYNPLTDTFEFEWERDYNKRKELKTIGYCGYFRLTNGFEKYLYFTHDEMLDHADKYSKAFDKNKYKKYLTLSDKEKEDREYSSFWYKSFKDMAFKTVLRQLISKWGIMSVDMVNAFVKDQAVMKENGDYEYVDNVDFDESIVVTPTENETVEPVVEEQPKPKSLKSVKAAQSNLDEEEAEKRRKELEALFN